MSAARILRIVGVGPVEQIRSTTANRERILAVLMRERDRTLLRLARLEDQIYDQFVLLAATREVETNNGEDDA